VEHGYNKRYYAYTITFGLGSTFLLLWLTFLEGGHLSLAWKPLVLLTTLAFISKFLSFNVMGVVTLSMDTAVYITAMLCMGVLPGAWAIFLSSYPHSLWTTLQRETIRKTEHRPALENLTAPCFQSGVSALVAIIAGHLLPIGDFVNGHMNRDFNVLWLALTLAALFVFLQYSLVLTKYWLRGYSWLNLVRQVFLPGLMAEMIMIPLAMVMALIYHSHGSLSLPLIFLVITYVIINFIFKKLSDARARLGEKVRDLESLNELGQVVCSNLQATGLVPALASQTLAVIVKADVVMIHVWNEDTAQFEAQIQVRKGFSEDRFDMQMGHNLAHWTEAQGAVFTSGEPGDGEAIRISEIDGQRLDAHAWMGLPVAVHGQTLGVILAYSEQPGVFNVSDLSLLEMIGRQAAVALQNSRLYVMATVDGLTGLFVRRYFDRRLLEEISRGKRYGTNFSLMLLDFDNFKDINDTHGHAVGDIVLRQVAEILLSEVRSLDLPARYGGDEFAIILPEVNWRGALILASRILYQVRRGRVRVGDQLQKFSLSIGLASFPEHSSEDSASLIAVADKALYKAKSHGKGQVVVYGEEELEEFLDE
jgi:diguanylate cyclase (GGDEF)-like protein